jgi:hypothetical protein
MATPMRSLTEAAEARQAHQGRGADGLDDAVVNPAAELAGRAQMSRGGLELGFGHGFPSSDNRTRIGFRW